jgi:hypothetical protein
MPIEFKRAYLEEIRFRYQKSSKKTKGMILDEFCNVCGLTRKHAIKILNGSLNPRMKRPGPKSKYQREDVLIALKELWQFMSQMCSKKMVVAFADWLPHYDAKEEVKVLLLEISASTVDRLLRPHRSPLQRGLSSTRPSLIKNRIPLKLLEGDIEMPGYFEADTVAHCGNSLAGEFGNSLTMTDLCSGWTENRAMWTKTAEKVVGQFKDIEERLPFAMIGVATDNGTEFLNDELLEYLKKREAPVNMVRRRPYKKNDNAHVEQKNWTHVRQLFGYDRVDDPALIPLMNEIYRAYWNPLQNYFTPVLKLTSKERIGGRVKKVYDEPKTPYNRLLESTYVLNRDKAILKDNFKTKNPIYLKKEMDKKIKAFFELVDEIKRKKRATGS